MQQPLKSYYFPLRHVLHIGEVAIHRVNDINEAFRPQMQEYHLLFKNVMDNADNIFKETIPSRLEIWPLTFGFGYF